jgi:hypothetical protein
MAIEHGVDGAFGREFDIGGETAQQPLADLPSTQLGCSCFTFRM